MSFKVNILANYASQVYVTLISIVMVPLYLKYMGTEAYGLVGFFAMLQAWLQLMDMGLTPTLSRELSRYCASTLSAYEAWNLVRCLEWFFGVLAVVCIVCSILGSEWIASNWLRVQFLNINDVALCIAVMGGIGGLRWLTGIYRSGLIGLDKQMIVSCVNVSISTLRSACVIFVLIYWSSSPVSFFLYQAGVAILECLIYQQFLYYSFLRIKKPLVPDWSALLSILGFAVPIAFTAGLWVVIMQMDKLILSHWLSLKEYAYFTLAVSVAYGVTLLSAPLYQALQPRLTVLVSQGRDAEFILLYRSATQFITVIMVSLAGTLAVFSESLIFAWTGNRELALDAAPILFWYALGNGILGIVSITYLMQYAWGKLRLHVIGNILFGLFWIPAVVLSSAKYGGLGAGVTWFAGNLLYLVIWAPIVHKRFAPSITYTWLIKDIVTIVAPVSIFLYVLSLISPDFHNRLYSALYLLFIGLCTLTCALLFSSELRKRLKPLSGFI